MAYVNGRWLEREERTQYIEALSKKGRALAQLVKSGLATEYQQAELSPTLTEIQRLRRIQRAEVDMAYFAYEYLSDALNSENEDNIIMNSPDGQPHDPIELLAPIHREFFSLCDHVSNEERNARLAIAAARGHSKSGVFSNAFPLHQIAFRKRKYVLVISETDSLSKKLIGWVNKQLKFNSKLQADFGVLMYESNSRNEKDNEEAFITLSNSLVEASSAGKQLRGKRHGSARPDLVIVDDPSSVNNEGTREAREKLVHWFNSVVVPIGSKATSIVLVGTMVSATGLLNHVLKRKDFKSSFHGALISEPTNPKLWDEYCEIYARAEEKDEPDAFYFANEEALEDGVELAWSWRWTYRALMHEKVNMGTRAYNSEYRNLAFSEDEQFFFPEQYEKYHYQSIGNELYINYADLKIPVRELTKVAAWDIAMGKNKRSDYNAIIILGKYEKTGHIFVLDELVTKEPAHKFLDYSVEKIRQWQVSTYVVETINAYHEFYRQLQERLRLESIYSCRLKDVKSQNSSKEQRIEALQPLFENKTLVLNDRHTMLNDMLAQYPFHDHDDAPDALQMAVDNIARPKARIVRKPSYL